MWGHVIGPEVTVEFVGGPRCGERLVVAAGDAGGGGEIDIPGVSYQSLWAAPSALFPVPKIGVYRRRAGQAGGPVVLYDWQGWRQ